MRSMRTRISRSLAAVAAVSALAGAAATTASGADEHYCTGNLASGWRCGSTNAHTSSSIYVEVVTSHTACAGTGSFGGYSSNAGVNDIACTNGAGTNGGYFYNPLNAAIHGTVHNPNGATTDVIYDAHMSW